MSNDSERSFRMSETSLETKVKKKPSSRSPAYPFIAIDKALERAQQLYVAEGRYDTPVASAYNAWGFGAKSSGARQTAAALGYYGLVDVTGDNDARRIKISDLAFRILGDKRDDQSERNALIREAALNPAIHKHLVAQYPDGLPSDANVRHHLVFDKGFNENAAEDVISVFKTTASLTGLLQPHSDVDKPAPKDDTLVEQNELIAVSVGDKVQWSSAGVDMFQEPATVLGLSEDRQWVFVDAGDAAAPIGEITIMQPATARIPGIGTPPPAPPHVVAARAALTQRSQDDLGEDQTILSQGKLKSGTFEVRVTGEIGAKEIGKIIQLLEAQKLILSDDD
jgi:hypothetical protein